MKKKLTAIALLIALLLSCMVLPTSAKDEDISVLWANGDTVGKEMNGTPRDWTSVDHMAGARDKR